MNIHVEPTPLGQPIPGAAKPGNLYADLQSRTLWLGVDITVDPKGSVLISDMIVTMTEIAEAEETAKAYTRALLIGDSGKPLSTKGYAPNGHKHLAADITDFNAAVGGVIASTAGLKFNRYTVMMFAGSASLIGVDEWAGWALCDGTVHHNQPKPGGGVMDVTTPDLRDRFVMGFNGTGTHGQGKTNPSATADTTTSAGHAHTITPIALALSQIPAHQHAQGNLSGVVTGSMGVSPVHSHFITMTSVQHAGGVYRPLLVQSGNAVNVYTDNEAGHQHGVTTMHVALNGGLSSAAGSGGAHTHGMGSAGAHAHTVSTAELRDAIPWYALAFIMKL